MLLVGRTILNSLLIRTLLAAMLVIVLKIFFDEILTLTKRSIITNKHVVQHILQADMLAVVFGRLIRHVDGLHNYQVERKTG